DREDLRDRVADPGPEVRDDERPGPDEGRVILRTWVVGADDEALEMVDVRLEPDALRPFEDLARRGGSEWPVAEDPAEARIALGRRQLPDQGALVGDDRVHEGEAPGED